MISTVRGHFKTFGLEVKTGTDDFSSVKKIDFWADVNSITTNKEQRDTHLKSADFFNAEENPKLHFSGTKYEPKEGEGKLYGDLSIAGTTKPIVLQVEEGGIITDNEGNKRAGFSISGKISRKEYGLKYNATLEAGGVVVGDEIKILVDVELIKQKINEAVTDQT